jgi:hypothetical protein
MNKLLTLDFPTDNLISISGTPNDDVWFGSSQNETGLTHFKMKNPVRAGLSRLWATSEKSRKNPPLRRFGERLRKS